MRPINIMSAAAFALAATSAAASAQSGPEDMARLARGRVILADKCASCHAIDRADRSPLPAAPPFRDLHAKYDVGALAESLAEGIVTGHAAMPVFEFSPQDVSAIIAYLRSLE